MNFRQVYQVAMEREEMLVAEKKVEQELCTESAKREKINE